MFCSSGYLLVHPSLVGVEETDVWVGDLQIGCGVKPFIFGIEWLQSRHHQRLKKDRVLVAIDLPPTGRIEKLLPSNRL